MRVKLPESPRDRKRSFGGATVSTLLHAALIGGSVAATGAVVVEERPAPPPEHLIYVPPRPTVPPARRADPPPVAAIPTNVDPVPSLQVATPDLSVVPDGLPPPTSTIGTMAVDSFRVAPRDTVPAGPVVDAGTPMTADVVEKAVQPRAGNPVPRYPVFLSTAGIEGTVWARFVVDTAGRVEPASIDFVRSDHTLFEREVRQVLLRSRFTPAEFGGQRVRQLVEQAFAFALKK